MAHIILTDEQVRQLNQMADRVEVRDARNNLIGYLQIVGFTAEEIAAARRAADSDEPRYTTEQVLAHLRSLEPR